MHPCEDDRLFGFLRPSVTQIREYYTRKHVNKVTAQCELIFRQMFTLRYGGSEDNLLSREELGCAGGFSSLTKCSGFHLFEGE